jgi:hypothetical protein
LVTTQQERRFQFGFEPGDLLAERGLGHAEVFGRFRKASGVDDRDEVLELANIHKWSLER